MNKFLTKKTQLLVFSLSAAMSMAISGCAGNEPLTALGDPTAPLTNSFVLPVTATSYTAFTSAADMTITPTFSGGSFAQIKAPGTGVVSYIDATSVTIFHNVHVSTRLTNLTPQVLVGSYVNSSTAIGIQTVATPLKFTVLVDNISVCPLTYLDTTSRLTLYQYNTNINPCQN